VERVSITDPANGKGKINDSSPYNGGSDTLPQLTDSGSDTWAFLGKELRGQKRSMNGIFRWIEMVARVVH
jgi:hypothetical protein